MYVLFSTRIIYSILFNKAKHDFLQGEREIFRGEDLTFDE